MTDLYDQKKGIIVSLAVISFIMAFIAPAAIFYPLKAGFITLRAEGIGSSPWALVTGGSGLLLLSIMLIVLVTVNRKPIKILLTAILFIGSLAGILLSLRDYYYITPESLVVNGPFTLTEKQYQWTDFESFEEQIRRKDGTLSVDKIIYTTKSGEVLEFSGGKMLSMSGSAKYRIEAAGGETIRTVIED